MVRILRCLLALCAVLLAQVSLARADEEVDLLLVLAVDVSRSIDQTKFLLQRDGYAAAISNRGVLEAIRSGPHQRIGLNFVEWSGFGAQKLVIDWTVIDSPDTARRFGDQIVEAPRSFADRTSISGGIEFAAAQIARSPLKAPRHIIDVSGDGTNNAGRDVGGARDEAAAKGIIINGLVILRQPAPVQRRAYQPARRPGEVLPGQRHRGSGRVRDGGGGLQRIRQGHHQEADRRDRGRPLFPAAHRLGAVSHVNLARPADLCHCGGAGRRNRGRRFQ